MAWPVANATNDLEKLSTNAPAAFNPELKRFNDTELVWQANRRKLVLSNLRVMAPTLEAAPDKSGEFLLLGFFPRLALSQSAPDELWKQIQGRTDLVYYDWEMTGPRLQQWRLLGRIFLKWPRVPPDGMMDTTQIGDKWLGDLGPLIGNTVTEITRAAPNELSVVRNSPVGFTGIEMFLLSEWLSAAAATPMN
jgi:hypothetical protein